MRWQQKGTAFNRTFLLWTGCAIKIDFGIFSVYCTGWKAEERTDFKVALLDCKWPHRDSSSTSYVADERRQPADFVAWRRLRSASSASLIVRRTQLSTIADRPFPVATARVWSSLPQHVTSAPSLPVSCSRFQTTSAQSADTALFNYHHLCHAREMTLSFRTRWSFSLLTYLLTYYSSLGQCKYIVCPRRAEILFLAASNCIDCLNFKCLLFANDRTSVRAACSQQNLLW